ncbi:UpxY family transcription antiterminator [bacterium]|nr:UpxY family transcription antiterminator [bacterium]
MSETEANDRKWYALYTKPRHEKKVDLQLREKGLTSYLPLRTVQKRWSDRKKWVDEPLFRSYVFVRADSRERYDAVQSYGALRVVGFKGVPIVVPDEEIDRIRRILREVENVEPADYFTAGDPVEIVQGPLSGMRGVLEEVRNDHRLVVRIESVRQALKFSVLLQDVKRLAGKR